MSFVQPTGRWPCERQSNRQMPTGAGVGAVVTGIVTLLPRTVGSLLPRARRKAGG